jgi:hypothetical protein
MKLIHVPPLLLEKTKGDLLFISNKYIWHAMVIIAFSGCLLHYIFVVQQKFPELSEEDKDCAMRQVESQYNNRRYRLLQAYRNNMPRPQHVSQEC